MGSALLVGLALVLLLEAALLRRLRALEALVQSTHLDHQEASTAVVREVRALRPLLRIRASEGERTTILPPSIEDALGDNGETPACVGAGFRTPSGTKPRRE